MKPAPPETRVVELIMSAILIVCIADAHTAQGRGELCAKRRASKSGGGDLALVINRSCRVVIGITGTSL